MLGTSEYVPRSIFMASISRVAVESIALAAGVVSALLLCVTIGARYSLCRTVLGSSETPAPIISFRTQQIPIFTALAQAHVQYYVPSKRRLLNLSWIARRTPE
jgi:acyl-CoA oxidase